MSSFLEIVNIKRWIIKIKMQRVQLELYYPKNTYDRFARREMKAMLVRFNELFYKAYPKMLSGQSNGIVDYHPRTHSRQYDVQRAVSLCKSQKVRRKDLVKIEEQLNLQYIIEEQLRFYGAEVEKAQMTMQVLSIETSSSFYPELFAERIKALENLESHYIKRIYKLEKEREICVKAISDLLHRNRDFIGQASKFIGELVAESVKSVVGVVNQSFGRKK